jgi:hypothetical protein
MKLTKQTLKQIIREELSRLAEDLGGGGEMDCETYWQEYQVSKQRLARIEPGTAAARSEQQRMQMLLDKAIECSEAEGGEQAQDWYDRGMDLDELPGGPIDPSLIDPSGLDRLDRMQDED